MTMHVHWSNNIYELMLEKNVIVYKLPVVYMLCSFNVFYAFRVVFAAKWLDYRHSMHSRLQERARSA